MVPGKPLRIRVVTATQLEYSEARRALRGTWSLVLRCGVSASINSSPIPGIAISCGLAGGLRNDLPTGAVIIPSQVLRPDGTIVKCDADITARLRGAAADLGFPLCVDPIVTSATLIRGEDRELWAQRGYAGADMETGLLRADRLACVRVILDTPSREISDAWLNPSRVFRQPDAWRDLPFLMQNGPPCARRAAQVIAEMLLAMGPLSPNRDSRSGAGIF